MAPQAEIAAVPLAVSPHWGTGMITEGLSTVTDRYDYDAWGNEYPIMAWTTDNPYRYVGQLGYYTHWQDHSLSDLLHLGVRFYEPGVGRFGQVDQLRRDYGAYVYSADVPIASVDPTGLKEWCWIGEIQPTLYKQVWDNDTGKLLWDKWWHPKRKRIDRCKGLQLKRLIWHIAGTVYCGGQSFGNQKGRMKCNYDDSEWSVGYIRLKVKEMLQDFLEYAFHIPGWVDFFVPGGEIGAPGGNRRVVKSAWFRISLNLYEACPVSSRGDR